MKVLMLIIVSALSLRIYGLNWDKGFYLHPDERAIAMVATSLQFPKNVSEFLSPESPWNPHFFAYGSLPLYLLKGAGIIAGLADPFYGLYGGINLVGRFISTIFDLGTLLMVFLIGRKLFNVNVGLIGALFYGISVLPIQLSHFYAVDTMLTFFIIITLYQLLRFYEKPSIKRAILMGVSFGFALATKVSAVVLLASIGAALAVDFCLIFFRQPHRPRIWLPHLSSFAKRLILDGVIIATTTILTFAIVEPYAFIDFQTFWQQSMEQRQMTYDPFTFPYTLQYVGKIPYWHELKNIFLWGQGPFLATLSFLGALYFSILAIRKDKKDKWAHELIIATFFWIYFLVVGKFAVGWIRYMLPLYPLLSLFAAVFFFRLLNVFPKAYRNLFSIFYFLFSIAWPLSFINIYTNSNTRVLASNWINKNIPAGKTLAIEHWDDSLPLFGQEKYHMVSLSLYDPDTETKWTTINKTLSKTDYIILASNRLYTPLQKLTDCSSLPRYKCYPTTADYYKELFSGSLGFKKVAEFAIYPTIPILNVEINDQEADESFTVYDHPKVMILEKKDKKRSKLKL